MISDQFLGKADRVRNRNRNRICKLSGTNALDLMREILVLLGKASGLQVTEIKKWLKFELPEMRHKN
jgi:hypothetical protein